MYVKFLGGFGVMNSRRCNDARELLSQWKTSPEVLMGELLLQWVNGVAAELIIVLDKFGEIEDFKMI